METGSAASMATSAMGPSLNDGSEKQLDSVAELGTSTTASASGMGAVDTPKASMMSVVGPNFVIPKNKTLVPVTRTTKWEPLEPKKEEPSPISRKTKWGPDLTEEPAVKRGRALAYQTRAEQLAAQLESNNLEIDNNEATRSPSPPPIYDSMGHRMNTREGRKRDRLDVERREAIGECMNLNPFYKPPSGYRPVPKEAKLFIPAKDNPGYNFIGLILGPRGNTQKRLETETGCRITIRGKGSIKDGKSLPYRHGKDNDGTSEELHVHVASETWEKVDAAVAIIEPLLIPVDEDRNIYKMKQLRELAEMNGTVRDFIRICTLCGEEGHREWQCPKDKLQLFQAKVICRLCGDASHPTMDCPLKLSGQGKAIDKEYLNFLEELGVGLGGIDPPAKSDVDNPSNSPAADTSQPMLLTASGALPMPAKWMDGFNDFNRRMVAGGSENGGFPRLPFPFPFPPPGPQALRFLAPFLNPAFMEAFKGRPVPPPIQMMAFMFSALRGRFPCPPFGFRPDMMRPPMPPSSAPQGPPSMPAGFPTSGQCQTADSVTETTAENNFGGFPPSSGTTNESEQQGNNFVSSVTSSVEVPRFPSPVPNSTLSVETKPRSPPVPTFSSVIPTSAELPPSGYPILPVAPSPTLPSVRPLPSIRPVIPPVLQPPSFTPMGGPGFASTVVPPLGAGASKISSLDSQSVPTQTRNSWSEGQSSSTSEFEKPAPELPPVVLSKPSTLAPLPRMDSPHSFNFGGSRSHVSGLDCPLFPHPPSTPMNLGSYPPRSVPFGASTFPPSFASNPPSFASNPLQPFPSQIGMTNDMLLKSSPVSYPDSNFGASHFQPVGSFNAAPPVDDYRSFTPLSQRLNSASADFNMNANYTCVDAYQPGSRGLYAASLDPGSRGTASEAFDRDYKYEPSIPPHMLQQNLRSPWTTDLLSRTRPAAEQTWGQQEMGGGGGWLNSKPQIAGSRPSSQEADPEYEKLMSSVGVL
ncbi:hypothetical protein GOP47_0004352 [Adiantum capillus-veneris]|uniref:CCHC-type domain-containing protein n=1 Tax=Adiantum capillus-veneris TaxID=13818 RepID=A0A9D4V7X9_ADICA|nr:hypothetical protein GOP47_0004352 [Adiantum capillus-veneris]